MIRRLFIVFFFLPSLLLAFSFEELMGKGTHSWDNIRTQEDLSHLAFFKTLYEKSQNNVSKEQRLPKIFHFIWLGPSPFPKESIYNLKQWKEFYPDWKFVFWTDIERDTPIQGMEKQIITDFSLASLEEAFDIADNFKEKAFLLSLEILYQTGGVYLDHDMQPMQVFPLSSYDFIGSLAPVRPSIFSSSVYLSSHFFGARPAHPFFKAAIAWMKSSGKTHRSYFPGNAPAATIRRTQEMIYEALLVGAKEGLGNGRDCIFPYDALQKTSLHLEKGSWKCFETVREQKMRGKLEALNKEIPKTMVLIFLTIVLALIPRRWRRT